MGECGGKVSEGTVELASEIDMSESVGKVCERFIESIGEFDLMDWFEMDRGAQAIHTIYFGGRIVSKEW